MTERVPLHHLQVVAGLQCAKRLYLELRAPDLAAPSGAAAADLRRRAAVGVGRAARERFPGGVEVTSADLEEAVEATHRLLRSPSVAVMYGAAFRHDGLGTRVDILTRQGRDAFDLVAVKTATRLRERHELDIAVQLHVVESQGTPIGRAQVMHLDRDYVRGAGAVDLERLFVLADVTERARRLAAELPVRLRTMRAPLAESDPPQVPTGAHCLRPVRCPFFAHCHAGWPEHPAIQLPRVDADQLARLATLGIGDVRDIPPDFPTLTPLQRRACAVLRSGVPFRDPSVRRALAAITLPAHFIDFETCSAAVPVHTGTRPYENLPFQWSDHVLDAAGGLTHHEFLHDDASDPRDAFAHTLLQVTAGAASVVSYSSFEADVLEALATELPALAPDLAALRARIVDLLPIVRDHCYHPDFRGSFSLKTVLPALVPGLGYDDLVIRDGLMASACRDQLTDAATAPARKQEIRRHLLAYCARDTEALVALYRTLWNER